MSLFYFRIITQQIETQAEKAPKIENNEQPVCI
jgi:hypothetical protein